MTGPINVKTLYHNRAPYEEILHHLTDVLNTKGYLVVNGLTVPGRTEELPDLTIDGKPQRVYVQQETTIEDFITQWGGLYTIGYIYEMFRNIQGNKFYRVTLD